MVAQSGCKCTLSAYQVTLSGQQHVDNPKSVISCAQTRSPTSWEGDRGMPCQPKNTSTAPLTAVAATQQKMVCSSSTAALHHTAVQAADGLWCCMRHLCCLTVLRGSHAAETGLQCQQQQGSASACCGYTARRSAAASNECLCMLWRPRSR